MSKRGDPWFKLYPVDWLDGTRELSLEQRGAYIDAICMQMLYEAPLRDDYSWLAHQLHISKRKARAIVESLVELKKLRRTENGLVNDRCLFELESKLNQRRVNAEIAANRERMKREKSKNTNKINGSPTNSCHETSTTRARADSDPDSELKIDRSIHLSFGPSSEAISEGRRQYPELDHDRAVSNFRTFNSGKKLDDPDAAYLAWLETHAEWQKRRGAAARVSDETSAKVRILPGTDEWAAWAEYVGPELAEGARRKGYMLVSSRMPPRGGTRSSPHEETSH
jgi:uncharacterized protein YdaU (DUF1376 family)